MQVATRLESLWDEFGEVVARDDKDRAYDLRSEILDLQRADVQQVAHGLPTPPLRLSFRPWTKRHLVV